MKVSRTQLVQVLEAIAIPTAERWDDDKLLKKVNEKGKLEAFRQGNDIEDLDLAHLYNALVKATEDGDPIVLDEADAAVPGKKIKVDASRPKDKKSAKTKVKANGKKPTKAKPAKAASTNGEADLRGPGVIGAIIDILKNASKAKPLSKKGVLAKLSKQFTDRSEASMWNTTSSYIPNRILKEKGVKVETDGHRGFWINASGKASENGVDVVPKKKNITVSSTESTTKSGKPTGKAKPKGKTKPTKKKAKAK